MRLPTLAIIRCCLVLTVLLAPSRDAGAAAIVSFGPGSVFSSFSSDETVGWQFTVTPGLDISVTSLGWWDQTPATPLAASHQVGLWTLGGVLLASATVLPTSPLSGSFRYVDIAPVVLLAGASYVIGGRDLTTDGDNYITAVSGLVTDPRIVFNQAARSPNASGFAFPNIFEASSGGRFGPNFEFLQIPVPEPASLALLGIGVGGLGGRAFLRRRRRQ